MDNFFEKSNYIRRIPQQIWSKEIRRRKNFWNAHFATRAISRFHVEKTCMLNE